MGAARKPMALAAKVIVVMRLRADSLMPNHSAANPVESVQNMPTLKVAPKVVIVASLVNKDASPTLVTNIRHAAPNPRADLRATWTAPALINRHADPSPVPIVAQRVPKMDLAWLTATAVAVVPRPTDATIAALIVTLAT